MKAAVVITVAFLSLWAVPVFAQSRQEARAEHERGLEAAENEQWLEAFTYFAMSYEMFPDPAVLLDLARSQAQVGRLAEAAASYRRFLDEVTRGRLARLRPQAQRALNQIEPRIPRLRAEFEGLDPTDQVLLDGEAIDPQQLIEGMQVNPAQHFVTVMRGDEEVAREVAELQEGTEMAITINLLVDEDGVRRPPPNIPIVTPVHPPDDDGGVASSPWFWAGIGAAVAAAAAIVIYIVFFPIEDDPFSGNWQPGVIEL